MPNKFVIAANLLLYMSERPACLEVDGIILVKDRITRMSTFLAGEKQERKIYIEMNLS
jgi:hypothetical protein